MALSRVNRTNGLHKIPFEDALAGDLLIYGYRDEAKRWRGHHVGGGDTSVRCVEREWQERGVNVALRQIRMSGFWV